MELWKLTATGGTSLSGKQLFEIAHPDQGVAWVSRMDFVGPLSVVTQVLAEQGLFLIGKAATDRLIECVSEVQEFPPVPIIDKSGWSGGYFALPDGAVFAPKGSAAVRTMFATERGKCRVAGTLRAWKREVADPLTGQVLVMFAIMLAFVAPLLRISGRLGNFGFEFVGPGGIGKTTAQMLMASVLGGIIDGDDGCYWITFDATLNAMEAQMLTHSDLPLVIEEASLALADESAGKRSAYFKAFAFRMGGGREKSRYAAPAKGDHRFVFLSSSNEPFAELVGQDSDVAKAAGDRLITLNIPPDRAHGVFDSLPEGYESGSHYAETLIAAAAANHGTAIRQFLTRLVQARADDETDLRALIARKVRTFRRKAGVDGNNGSAVRVADAFGLVYAAGELAKSYGVLPKGWRCGPAALACYRHHRMTSQPTKTFEQQLLDLAKAPSTVHLQAGELVSREVMETTDVFVRHGLKGDELFIQRRAINLIFPTWRTITRRKEVIAMSIREGDHTTSKRLLLKNGKPERIFCFRLPRNKQCIVPVAE